MVISKTSLSRAGEDQLAKDDPEVLAELQSKDSSKLDTLYPQPTLADVEAYYAIVKSDMSEYNQVADRNNDVRYQRDTTPAKWARYLEQGRRVFTRRAHNEILRVVAMVCRNPYKVHKPPAGPGEIRDKRAEKQERWCQEYSSANHRRAGKDLRRIVVDGACESGRAGWEIYLTGSYDDLKLEDYQTVYDEVQGSVVQRKESASEYMRRTENVLMEAGMPVCVRPLHRAAFWTTKDDEGTEKGIIVERKPYRQVYAKLRDKLSADQLRARMLPEPGTPGWPVNLLMGQVFGQNRSVPESMRTADANGDVETWRYYDRRWYWYIVGGIPVDDPVEHGLPGVPIIEVDGIITSSPNPSEQYEGITWGMESLELASNDLLTLALDTSYTFNRPRPIAVGDKDARPPVDPKSPQKLPPALDLSDPHKLQWLPPGYTIVDAYKDFRGGTVPVELLSFLQNLWQQNGRSPAAQGVSPGSDTAGYTLNSLIGASDDMYGIILDNDARAWGLVLDFVLKTIKYTIGERVYLPVQGTGKRKGQVEWLALGPDDIDDVPTVVTIDPTTEQNRMAQVKTYTDGWQNGVVPRRELQEKGYGAESPELWDDEIIEEAAVRRLTDILIDNVMARVMPAPSPQAAQQQAQQQQGGDAGGGGGSQQPAGAPPPPTVGAATAQATQGSGPGAQGAPNSGLSGGATAGQNNGYVPPAGASQTGARGGG